VLNKLSSGIEQIYTELHDLAATHSRTRLETVPPLKFFVRPGPDIARPTYDLPIDVPPGPDRARAEDLLREAGDKVQAAKSIMAGILALVRENPFLTQFVKGLEISGRTADVPDPAAIEAELADAPSLKDAQQRIIETLNHILVSIAHARQRLCDAPERVLDVPLVYGHVQQMLRGINPRFDEVATSLVARHQRIEAWTDIGLGVAGLALFVGGLIVSVAGGPAGVLAFIELSGIVLGAVTAIRSVDKAVFLNALADASVERGGGLVTLEAARQAEFWATVDTVFVAVDLGATALRSARSALAARR